MTFIIAEAGVNHNGRPATAVDLIEAAKAAGADAVKFQLFDADKLEPEGPRRDTLKALELTTDDHVKLKAHCDEIGIQYLCTPFDVSFLQFLTETLGLRQIKISSGDIGNEPLLQAAADAGTVVLSTGASDIQDVRRAVSFINQQKRPNGGGLIVLHCVSAYPAPVEEMNLKAINTLRGELPYASIGFSDHSLGIALPIAAAAMGAVMIEKHITLDKTAAGPDHASSLEPSEFKAMVDGIRAVDSAMGDGRKRIMPSESPVLQVVKERIDFRNQLAKQTEDDARTARLAESAMANSQIVA